MRSILYQLTENILLAVCRMKPVDMHKFGELPEVVILYG